MGIIQKPSGTNIVASHVGMRLIRFGRLTSALWNWPVPCVRKSNAKAEGLTQKKHVLCTDAASCQPVLDNKCNHIDVLSEIFCSDRKFHAKISTINS